MFRDFLNANSTLKNKISKPQAKTGYIAGLKCLLYFLPRYLEAVTFNQARFSGGRIGEDDEEEDFEIEFQGLVVQVLSLMSTLISLYPKMILKEMKPLTGSLLLCMFMYSLKSPFEQEKNFHEDQNLFLTDFLMESSVDYDSQLSIRSTMVDYIDELFNHSDFNKQTLEEAITMLATDNFALGSQRLPSSEQVLASLA